MEPSAPPQQLSAAFDAGRAPGATVARQKLAVTETSDGAAVREALVLRVGHLEGQLAESRERFATLESELATRQLELTEARSVAATAKSGLSHFQHRA